MSTNPSTSSSPGSETPDPDTLHREMEGWAEKTVEEEPRVRQIGYLQSDDQAGMDSGTHLDLVIVVSDEFDLPPAERVGMWDLGAVPVPAQTLVYTEEEWGQLMEAEAGLGKRLKEGTTWVHGEGTT